MAVEQILEFLKVRIAPELHEQVAIAASQHGISLNRYVAKALSQAVMQGD